MLPGEEIRDHKSIAAGLMMRLYPTGAAAIDVMRSWRGLDPNGDELSHLMTADRYYIYHEHPVHAFKNRLSYAEREDVIEFIKRTFDIDRMEGLDVFVFTPALDRVLVGNHDGELFLAI